MQISSLSSIEHPSFRRAAQGLSRVVVGLCITKSTASVNLLGDDRTRTLARVEAAAARSAFGVAGARTSNELRSSTLASAAAGGRCLGGGGGDGGSGSGRLGRCFAEQRESRIVVGLRITKSTTSVNLLGEDRASTLARVKATAAGSAISVAGARTGDELCSSTLTSAVAGSRCLGGGGGSGRLGRCLGDGGGSGTAK